MSDNHGLPLQSALAEGKKRHPNAPPQHHAAFANSVAYLVTGWSGGYGGPSCREHAVSRAVALQHPAENPRNAGEWDFDDACGFAEPLCYEGIAAIHLDCYESESCFDDAPSDIEAIKAELAGGRKPINARICLVCSEVELRHNNKSGICTRCQRNKRTRKKEKA